MGRRGTAAGAALVLLAACGTATGGATGPPAVSGGAPTGSITVLAAASLTEVFGELGRRFGSAHPGAGVTFSFDASSALVQQVKAGAPADVLATADEATMQQAVDAGTVGPPAPFAHNRLAIIVARGNPKGVRTLADLARPDLLLVLCAREVPCGRFATQVLDRAGVRAEPRSFEPNVKGVVSKVLLGEADAGIVYTTDVIAAGARAGAVPIPSEQNAVATYPVATVRASANPSLAEAFTAFVRSGEARPVLAAAGFDP